MSFSKQIQAWAAKRNIAEAKAVAAIRFQAWELIDLQSPVDTGQFRANNFVSLGTVNERTTDSTTFKARESEAAVLSKQAIDSVFYIHNSLPYAPVIEFGQYPGDGPKTVGGFSTQAPEGVYRISAQLLLAGIDKEIKDAIS